MPSPSPRISPIRPSMRSPSTTRTARRSRISLLGGPSRLVFQLPDAYTPVPYSLSQILSLCGSSSLVLSTTMQNTLAAVVPVAQSSAPDGDPLLNRMLATALAATDPAAAAHSAALNGQLPPVTLQTFPGTGTAPTTTTGPAAPEPQGMSDNSVTQIEIPFRLKLSPNCMAGWSHAASPVEHVIPRDNSSVFEVWHTSLGVRSVAANVAGDGRTSGTPICAPRGRSGPGTGTSSPSRCRTRCRSSTPRSRRRIERTSSSTRRGRAAPIRSRSIA